MLEGGELLSAVHIEIEGYILFSVRQVLYFKYYVDKLLV
jgi:hypothetical protein